MAAIALQAAKAAIASAYTKACTDLVQAEASLRNAQTYYEAQRIVVSPRLIVENGDTIHAAWADVGAAKRAIEAAKRAKSEAEIVRAQGVMKEELAAIREAYPLKGVKSEVWRQRAEAVEKVQKEVKLRLNALYVTMLREQYSSGAHKRVRELLGEAEDEERRGARKEREAMRAALASVTKKVATKKMATTLKLMIKMPVEVCMEILGFLDPRSRAAFACVNRTFRDAVLAFEIKVPRELSIAAAKAAYELTSRALAKKAEEARRKRLGFGEFVLY